MASADTPQIHVQHEQESSYTRPTETDQSSSVNDAQRSADTYSRGGQWKETR